MSIVWFCCFLCSALIEKWVVRSLTVPSPQHTNGYCSNITLIKLVQQFLYLQFQVAHHLHHNKTSYFLMLGLTTGVGNHVHLQDNLHLQYI